MAEYLTSHLKDCEPSIHNEVKDESYVHGEHNDSWQSMNDALDGQSLNDSCQHSENSYELEDQDYWKAGILGACGDPEEVTYVDEEDSEVETVDHHNSEEDAENIAVRKIERASSLLKAARQAEENARANAVQKSKEESAKKRADKRRILRENGHLWFQTSHEAVNLENEARESFVKLLKEKRLPIPNTESEFHAARFYSDQLENSVYDVEQWQEYLDLVEGRHSCTGRGKSPLKLLFRFDSM